MLSTEMNSNEIISNGEKFIRTDYNGISVIIDSNGYYNASKICSDNKTRFLNISRNNYWTDYLSIISLLLKIEQQELIVEKLHNNGFSIDVQGVYIHPKLVNYLCIHVNLEYAVKVSEIMDLMNERIHINNSNLEEEIEKLKKENEKLEKLAVPEGTNTKLLRILKIRDNKYKITADSYRSDKSFEKNGFKVIHKFILASSMNVRQVLRESGQIKKLKFTNYEEICKYIRDKFVVLSDEKYKQK